MHGSSIQAPLPGRRARLRAVTIAALGAVVLATVPAAAHAAPAPPAPAQLTVGDAARPLAVEGAPRFGWQLPSARGDDRQTAYEVRVTRAADGAEVWTSGKVASSDQSYVTYRGPSLAAGASYDWTVRRWDADDQASAWSEPAHFDAALGDGDWSGASWIRRVTTGNDSTDDYSLARKVFSVSSSPVVRARAYASGQAQYELHLNGRRVVRGDSFGYAGEGQYTATDVTDDVQAGEPLAVGAMEHYWTCTCQGRANGPASNTTLAAAAVAGDTTLKVASNAVFDVGDRVDVDTGAGTQRVVVTSVGTAGADGTGVGITPALTAAHANKAAVADLAGPTGLLVKVVVDHADGSRQTFVSDGSWKVAKNPAYLNATIVRRNGDAGDNTESYDARKELTGWDTPGFDDSAWEQAMLIGTHPRPVNPLRDEYSHLDPAVTELRYETVHPVSLKTLADGTVIADFGKVLPAMPRLHLENGVAGRRIDVLTSYRRTNTRLAAATAAGTTNVRLASVANLQVGDDVTVDAPAANQGPGDPETRTITAVGTAGADGTGLTLDRPLDRAHESGAWTEGSRAGTSSGDTQGSKLNWTYTAKDGVQTGQAYTYWGWRYMQISPTGEPLTKDDVTAVVQKSENPTDRRATFQSDNPTLDGVFELMQRSGEDSVQETYLDTPTREKGGFLGDGIDISWANMTSVGERGATVRGIREAIYGGIHSWKTASSGYCTAIQVPCSYASLGTPGRLNSVYPNGDNMRDIPDYTEAFPDWVWRYYLLTGDKATLAAAYPTLQAISAYIEKAQPETGPASGLVYQLPGGTSSYANGIIDWPAPMRYGYTFTNNGARTIHSAEAVGAYAATEKAAKALGKDDDAAQYAGWRTALTTAVNAKLVRPDGLYSDGLSTADGNPQIDNAAQHAQTYPIYFGLAPRSTWPTLAKAIVAKGMNQGPMTWHVLLKALADAGQEDQVVKLLTDAKADGPARILAEDGTFMWEQWSPSCSVSPCTDRTQSNNESQSHGWGSWGVVDVVETLLGVEVTSPGASTVTIAPPALDAADLHHVKGSAWTQRGTVGVEWTRKDDGTTVAVDVPANVRAEVRIPDADGRAYAATGDGGATFVREEDGVAVFSVGSGHTAFAPASAPAGGGDDGQPAPGGATPGAPAPGTPAAPAPAPAAPGKPAATPDRTAPRLTGVARSGSVRVRSRVTLELRTSEAGRLRIGLVRLVPGRRSGKACRALGTKDRRRSTCTAQVPAASPAAVTLKAGTQSVRIGTTRLKAGRYRATVTATDAAGNRSSSRTVAFTVVGR